MPETDYSTLNVYKKLALARLMFAQVNVKKSGQNNNLEFKYYELSDISPVAIAIGNTIGLVFLTSFTDDDATMTVVNCDNPSETIVFNSPMREIEVKTSKTTGGKITNEVQNLGSAETYQRRYLYLLALDITENDVFDAEVGTEETIDANTPPVKKPTTERKPAPKKAPVTAEKREEIKQEITDADGQAEPLQIEALQGLMEQILEIDPEQEELIQAVVMQTNKLTDISKQACERLIGEFSEMVEAYEQAAKEA